MIDVNKKYRTRDGHDVMELICFSKERFLFKNDTFFGQLVPKKGERTTFVEWDHNGKAFGFEKDHLDLVEVEDDKRRT